MIKKFSHLLFGIGLVFGGLLLASILWKVIVRDHLDLIDDLTTGLAPVNAAEQQAKIDKAKRQSAEYHAQQQAFENQAALARTETRLRIQMLPRYAVMKYYFVVGGVALCLVAGLGILCVFIILRIKRGSVWMAQLEGNTIPIPEKKLPEMAGILSGLVTAKQMEAHAPTEAMKLYADFCQLELQYTKAILAHRQPTAFSLPPLLEGEYREIDQAPPVPTFAELLEKNMFSFGGSLILGYANGDPQYRDLTDIKALSVAGWQGSGKTYSTAYLVTSLLLLYPQASAYIIDPHQQNPEGLGYLLKPLEDTKRLQVVREFYLPQLITHLDHRLDARLSGKESTTDPIVLVIDELARVAKSNPDMFQTTLLPFIERCTEETRKANMLFIGCSQKWAARNFGYKADIRGTMPSLLVHKTKPSQAALLLEDTQEKKLVKQLQHPGQAVLATSHDADPSLVQMPYIAPRDIQQVASQLTTHSPSIDYRIDFVPSTTSVVKPHVVDWIDHVNHWLSQSALTQQEFSQLTELDTGFLSRILNRKQPASDKAKSKILQVMESQSVPVL